VTVPDRSVAQLLHGRLKPGESSLGCSRGFQGCLWKSLSRRASAESGKAMIIKSKAWLSRVTNLALFRAAMKAMVLALLTHSNSSAPDRVPS
jgi:hypothetical protein